MQSRRWGGVQALSLSLPFPLRAPGTEMRAAPCPREGSAGIPVWARRGKRLESPGLAVWKDSVAADPCSQPQPGTGTRGGCRCISGRAPFSALCAWRPACALPAGGAGLARRARPSLRQWVWIGVGKEGESRLASSHSHPCFFSPSKREVPSFCGVSRLYCTLPSRVSRLWRTGRGL